MPLEFNICHKLPTDVRTEKRKKRGRRYIGHFSFLILHLKKLVHMKLSYLTGMNSLTLDLRSFPRRLSVLKRTVLFLEWSRL